MRYICTFILLITLTFSQNEDKLTFSSDSLARAEKEKKLVFLFIGSDVCLESRNFLREIVRDKDFYSLIIDDFVFALLDYDLNPALSIRYSIPTIPGFMIVGPDSTIYFGATKPTKEKVYPLLLQILDTYKTRPQQLKEELRLFEQDSPEKKIMTSVQDILDSTLNFPNHVPLDLGRYILSLPQEHPQFKEWMTQMLEWLRSENYDTVDGSFFMPRGFSTYFAESKYSFFNFKLMELILDFYQKTGHPTFKRTLLKSLKILEKDLFLQEKTTYSTGYSSKKYFKMNLQERLKYFPPAPRNFDLAITQLLYLKLLYKLEQMWKQGFFYDNEVQFLIPHFNVKLDYFSRILNYYRRDDGLLYFTRQRKFTNLETQLEFFSLLHLMQQSEPTRKKVFFDRMKELFESLKSAFYDSSEGLMCDVPLNTLKEHPVLYQYPLYFVREHSRLLAFLDLLYVNTREQSYQDWKIRLWQNINKHNTLHPERFYWLNWYRNITPDKQFKEQ
jgi:hypothetical protein